VVHRERAEGGLARIGEMIPRETQKDVRAVQIGNGSIWRKELVRPGGLEMGSVKEKGPNKQVEGSSKGRGSAQAI
jgi:hypothetical protein